MSNSFNNTNKKKREIKEQAIESHKIASSRYSRHKHPFYDNFRGNDEQKMNKRLLYELMRLDG